MGAISQNRIQQYWAAGEAAATAHGKGQALEQLVRYAFEKITGVQHYMSNVVNQAQSEEVDVAFYNSKEKRGLPFLEHLILAECKNWSAPVGAPSVREFTTKLKHRACANGILVAANGITGDPQDRTAAHDAVRMALAVERIRILVITRGEIDAWTHSDDIVELLKLKLCQQAVEGSIFL